MPVGTLVRVTVERLRQTSFGLVLLISLCVFLAPSSAVPTGPTGMDKAVHVASFIALSYTIVLAGASRGRAVALLLAYGALTEVTQTLLPVDRSGSVWDFVADAIGIGLGIALSLALRRPGRWWTLPR